MALLAQLTASERFLLNEVDSVPDKVVRYSVLRQSARHMTCAGFSRVVDKMFRRNLLARDGDTVTITFAGFQALKGLGSTPVPSATADCGRV